MTHGRKVDCLGACFNAVQPNRTRFDNWEFSCFFAGQPATTQFQKRVLDQAECHQSDQR